MIVLSLFDGMSCGRIALDRTGINVSKYYASEIDKYAIKVSQANYPNIIQMGSVTEWRDWDIDWSTIDLVIGGSPCQGFSAAGKQGGTKCEYADDEFVVTTRDEYLAFKALGAKFLSQSYLFWEYVLLLDHVRAHNPKLKFMLENVKMSKNNMDMITDALGVEPEFINSALVSAQNRQRWYWANWYFDQPEDKGLRLKDIIESGINNSEHEISLAYQNRLENSDDIKKKFSVIDPEKAICMTARQYANWKGNLVTVDREKSQTILATIHKENAKSMVKRGKTGLLVHSETVDFGEYTEVKCIQDNPRVKGITEDTRGYRPHQGDTAKSGVSEIGRVLKETAQHTDCLTAAHPPKVEVKGGAMRGRNLDENGTRQDHRVDSSAGKTEQRIEVRTDDKTNCLTTVQKDNQVVYGAEGGSSHRVTDCVDIDKENIGLIKAGMATDIKGHDSNRRIYDVDGKAPTLLASTGGHKEPKISIEPNETSTNDNKSYALTASYSAGCNAKFSATNKQRTLTPTREPVSDAMKHNNIHYRKLTPVECERLQTVPDGYTSHVSNTQRYRMLGNGWTIDVIAHIFSHLPVVTRTIEDGVIYVIEESKHGIVSVECIDTN